jgi:hypothetical protein
MTVTIMYIDIKFHIFMVAAGKAIRVLLGSTPTLLIVMHNLPWPARNSGLPY